MARRNEYETVLIIKGDGKGGVQAAKATKDELEKLNDTQEKGAEKAKKYGKTHKDSEKDVGKFSLTVKAGAAAVAKAAFAAAGALGAMVGVNTKLLQETDRTASRLGISTQAFMAQAETVRIAGLEQQGYADVLKDVSVRVQELATVGTGEAADFFDHLNLDVQEFANLAPDELLKRIGHEMQSLNRSDRILFLDQLGSDNAIMLVDVIDKLEEMEAEAIAVGAALSDIDMAQVSMAAEGMDRIGMVARGAANQITAEFAPIVADLAERFVDAAVEAGGLENMVESFVDGAVFGLGYVGDALRRFLILLKSVEYGWTMIAATATSAMADQAEAVASLMNKALSPLLSLLGTIADGWGAIMFGLSRVPGPFKDEFLAASDVLSSFSRDIVDFSVDASDLVDLNETMQARLAASRGELDALLASKPPSEALPQWLEQVRDKYEELAAQTVEARDAQNSQTDAVDRATIQTRELIAQMEFESTLLGMTSLEQKILTNLRKLDSSATDEQRAAVRRLTIERHNAESASKREEEAAKVAGQARINQIENTQEALAELIYDDLRNGELRFDSFFDSIIDGYERVYAQFVSKNLTEALFSGSGGNISNILGISKLVGPGAAGNSILGSLSNITGISSLLQGVPGTAGFVGPMMPGAGGIGSMLGSIPGWGLAAAGLGLLATQIDNGDGWERSSLGFSSGPTPMVRDKYEYGEVEFASGMQATLINRRGDQAAADTIAQIFQAADARVVDIVTRAGGFVDASDVQFKGTHADYGHNDGNFFGLRGGRDGLENESALQPLLASYTRQLIEQAEGLNIDLNGVLAQGGNDAEAIIAALESALGLGVDSAQDNASSLEDVFESMRDSYLPVEAATQRYKQELEKLEQIQDQISEAQYDRIYAGIKANLDAVIEREEQLDRVRMESVETLLASMQNTSSLQRSIRDQMYALQGISVIGAGVSGDIDAQIQGIAQLRDLAISAHQEKVQLAEELHNRQMALGRSFSDYVHGLRLGDNSTLSSTQRYALARAEFEALAAKAGDSSLTMSDRVAAGEYLQGAMDSFLEISRTFNASNSQYKSDFDRVLEVADMVTTQLQPSGEFDPSEANAALIAELGDLQSQLSQLNLTMSGRVVEELMEIRGSIDNLSPELASALAVIMGEYINSAIAEGQYKQVIADSIPRGTLAESAANKYRQDNGLAPIDEDRSARNDEYSSADIAAYVESLRASATSEEDLIRQVHAAAKAGNVGSAQLSEAVGISQQDLIDYAVRIGLPSFSGGGIANGPDTGYLALLHGKEEVTPVGPGSSAAANSAELISEVRKLRGDISGLYQVAMTEAQVSNTKYDKIADSLANIDRKTGINNKRRGSNANAA